MVQIRYRIANCGIEESRGIISIGGILNPSTAHLHGPYCYKEGLANESLPLVRVPECLAISVYILGPKIERHKCTIGQQQHFLVRQQL